MDSDAGGWQIPAQPVRVPWGPGELELHLPGDWPVFQARPAPDRAPPRSLAEMLHASLASPLGLPRLREVARDLARRGPCRVALVVDDNTRHTPADQVLPVVLEHLDAGRTIPDDRIEIHFAGGTHTPMTRRQMADKVSPQLAERFACYGNPVHDPSQYRYLGRTRHNTPLHLSARVADADLRILIGSVSAHLQAGFGGGMKLLFPGLAALATISRLHLRGTETFSQLIGVPGEHNPMRREIDRLVEYLDGVTFAVQLLLDSSHQPVAVSAGHPSAAQRVLAEQAADRFGIVVPGQADILIANSYPLEYDLWQGFKCIANTLFAARPGGVIVAMLKADQGSNRMKLPSWTLSRQAVRTLLRLTGREGLLSVLGRLLPQVSGEGKFFVRFCLNTIRRNAVLIYSPTLAGEGVRFPGLEIFDSLADVWRRAGELVTNRPPRVTVFGQGGTCYPLLESP